MNTVKRYIKHPLVQNLLFWVLVFACYSIVHWEGHGSMKEVLETYTFKVGLQALVTYACFLLIIPPYLARKNKTELAISILLLLLVLQLIVTSWRTIYLEPTYFVTYANCLKKYGHLTFWQRFFDVKDFFFKNPATYLPPFFVLITIQYYQRQQKISELNEQKKTAELNALKNQLNPHFLFNTLNNLYMLSIKKSDKAPEIIGKLSDILDYTLYRCNDKFVPIAKEVKLIENYLTLEEIRYRKRVAVSFQTDIKAPLMIAPLVLLTFIENAFKHGVKSELNQATIDMHLATSQNNIIFTIKNSIPRVVSTERDKAAIGLENVKKQLALLYPNAHQLEINQTKDLFEVKLNLKVV